MFDKKEEPSNNKPTDKFNPWQSAQAEDISTNNSWADFGSSTIFTNSNTNPFSANYEGPPTDVSSVFPSNVENQATAEEDFKSSFDVDFDAAFNSTEKDITSTSTDPASSDSSCNSSINSSCVLSTAESTTTTINPTTATTGLIASTDNSKDASDDNVDSSLTKDNKQQVSNTNPSPQSTSDVSGDLKNSNIQDDAASLQNVCDDNSSTLRTNHPQIER